TTGALAFVSAPDYEGGQTSFAVTVTASDGTLFDTQDITVNLTDVNDNTPTITSNGAGATASVNVAENSTAVTTVTATDADGTAANNTVGYSITGGADSALFSINASTGALAFVSAPDYEGGQTSFAVTVTASDGTLFDTQDITVNLTDVNDNTPTITSNGGGATASVNVAENSTAVTTVTATDADGTAANNTVGYSITGGADSALFSINASTGALAFVSAPDYE